MILHEIGAISDGEFRTYEWLRRLRNRAANDPLFELSRDDLAPLTQSYRDPTKINELCVTLVAGFWNAHLDDLLPRFAPSLLDASLADKSKRDQRPNKALQPPSRKLRRQKIDRGEAGSRLSAGR
jgi:hypothetical protein